MLVCHCKAVNEQRIREAIAQGARDEFDVADLCGAGSGCGGCVPVITALLAEGVCAPGCPVSAALHSAPAHAASAPPGASAPACGHAPDRDLTAAPALR
jgi:bacterioferritin-associated ferredoxin